MEKESMIVCAMKGEFGFARLESKRSEAIFFHLVDCVDTPGVLFERWNLLTEGAPIFAAVKTQEGGRLRAEGIELYSLEEIQETDPYYQPPIEPNVEMYAKKEEKRSPHWNPGKNSAKKRWWLNV